MPGGLYCCVYGCGNNQKHNRNKSFFSLPSDPKKLSEWLFLMRREDLLGTVKSGRLTQRICCDHFGEEYLTFTKKLKQNAIPLLKLPISIKKETEEPGPSTSKHKSLLDLQDSTTQTVQCEMKDSSNLPISIKKEIEIEEPGPSTSKHESLLDLQDSSTQTVQCEMKDSSNLPISIKKEIEEPGPSASKHVSLLDLQDSTTQTVQCEMKDSSNQTESNELQCTTEAETPISLTTNSPRKRKSKMELNNAKKKLKPLEEKEHPNTAEAPVTESTFLKQGEKKSNKIKCQASLIDKFKDGADSDSESGSESGESELWVDDKEAPARALAALNALRKSRQHFDVVLLAGGAEVPAHRALLVAASPYLLQALAAPASPAGPIAAVGPNPGSPPPETAAPAYRVEGVEADALKELVEYIYTGKLCARDSAAARRLYRGAWRLRLEAARTALAERLVRRLAPADCLETRALPDLPLQHLQQLDSYIADHFDELCGGGAMTALPLVRMELLRASSADGGEEAPLAVAEAALTWLRDHNAGESITNLEELCSRSHLVFVDARGELRDCGELPAARGDAPELQEYRRAAHERAERPAKKVAPPRPLPGLELGARDPRPHTAVLAAKGAGATPAGTCRVTRALVALHGRLLAAQIAWRDVGDGVNVAVGGPLGGARDAEGAKRAELTVGRCAHGTAVLGSRLVVCGGYDRARVLRAAEAYDPVANEWSKLPDMRTARARFPAARLQNKIYVFGGSDGHNELDSVDVYEEGATAWASRAKLPVAAAYAAAASDDSRGAIYVVGGWAIGRSLRSVHKYDPLTDMWIEQPSLTTGRSQCASVVWKGALWALGGCDAWHCLATTEKLDLETPGAQWTAGVPLPTARRSVGGCVWRDMLLSAGGSDGAASLRRCEFLTALGGAWVAGPELRRARAALGLHGLGDVLYAVGGFDGKEFLSCVECLYEPDGEWTTLCDPPAPRAALPPADTPQEETPHKERLENGSAIAAQ